MWDCFFFYWRGLSSATWSCRIIDSLSAWHTLTDSRSRLSLTDKSRKIPMPTRVYVLPWRAEVWASSLWSVNLHNTAQLVQVSLLPPLLREAWPSTLLTCFPIISLFKYSVRWKKSVQQLQTTTLCSPDASSHLTPTPPCLANIVIMCSRWACRGRRSRNSHDVSNLPKCCQAGLHEGHCFLTVVSFHQGSEENDLHCRKSSLWRVLPCVTHPTESAEVALGPMGIINNAGNKVSMLHVISIV